MDNDAKLQILIEALAAAGASALAIDEHGHVATSTMDDVALEQDVAAFVAERLGRALTPSDRAIQVRHADQQAVLTLRGLSLRQVDQLFKTVQRQGAVRLRSIARHIGGFHVALAEKLPAP